MLLKVSDFLGMKKKLSVCSERGWTVLDRRCLYSHRSQHPSANIALVMDTGTHLPMYFHFGKANDWLSLKGFLSQLLAGGGDQER